MPTPIYLDNAATTPVDPRVAEQMLRYLTPEGEFGNPASTHHRFGAAAREAVERARNQVSELIRATPGEIVWTSGATESINLALCGAAHHYAAKGRHIVTCKTEHMVGLDVCRSLEEEGFAVMYLDPESNGLIDLDKLKTALQADTILVSIMHVNNEIGVIQDIEAIGRLTRDRNVLLHVDAAQSAGKVPIDVAAVNVDLMSLCAHKIYGPKGVGALYVRRQPKIELKPLLRGGGHERGLRAGTLATHQIVGMGEAFCIAKQVLQADDRRIRTLRGRLWSGLRELDRVSLNGTLEPSVAGILNLSFSDIAGEDLLFALSDIALSSGSACTSATQETSHVLRALGCSDEVADSSIRFSLGRFTTAQEIDYTAAAVKAALAKLCAHDPSLGSSRVRGT